MMVTFGTDFDSEFSWKESPTLEFTELFPYEGTAISAPLDKLLQIDSVDKGPQQVQKPAPEPLRTTQACTQLEIFTPSDSDKKPAESLPKESHKSVQGTSRTSTCTARKRPTTSESDEEPTAPPLKKRKTSVRRSATPGANTTERVPIRICGVDGCEKQVYNTGDFERHLQTKRHGGGKSSCIRDFGCKCGKPLEGSRLDAVIRHVKNVREAAEKKGLELLEKENRKSSV